MGEDMTATIWEANSPDTLKGLHFDCYVTNLVFFHLRYQT
jgi:hypothetical protein